MITEKKANSRDFDLIKQWIEDNTNPIKKYQGALHFKEKFISEESFLCQKNPAQNKHSLEEIIANRTRNKKPIKIEKNSDLTLMERENIKKKLQRYIETTINVGEDNIIQTTEKNIITYKKEFEELNDYIHNYNKLCGAGIEYHDDLPEEKIPELKIYYHKNIVDQSKKLLSLIDHNSNLPPFLNYTIKKWRDRFLLKEPQPNFLVQSVATIKNLISPHKTA